MTSYPEIRDVAKRLRAATRITAGWAGEDIIDPLLHEGADEIERLRELLREADSELRAFGFKDLCDRIDAALAGTADQPSDKPLPGGTPVGELVAEWEKDPGMKAALEKARAELRTLINRRLRVFLWDGCAMTEAIKFCVEFDCWNDAEFCRDHYDGLAARLAHIAAIAHDGGLWSADDHKLWVAVRQLTLPYWQNSGDFNERRQRIADAMSAADSASGAT